MISHLNFVLVQFLTKVTTSYFFMDLTWVKVVPTCVKSPGVIVKVGCVIPLSQSLWVVISKKSQFSQQNDFHSIQFLFASIAPHCRYDILIGTNLLP